MSKVTHDFLINLGFTKRPISYRYDLDINEYYSRYILCSIDRGMVYVYLTEEDHMKKIRNINDTKTMITMFNGDINGDLLEEHINNFILALDVKNLRKNKIRNVLNNH